MVRLLYLSPPIHLTEQTGTFRIARGLFDQIKAKNLFHFIEAAETKGTGKPDQGRRRNASLLGNDRDSLHSNYIFIIYQVFSNLL
ncbi:hypothetical protein D3C72_2180590 [compost metagenome]